MLSIFISDRKSWLNDVFSLENLPGIGKILTPRGLLSFCERLITSQIKHEIVSTNISPGKGSISMPQPQTEEYSIKDSGDKQFVYDCLANQSSSRGENITPLKPTYFALDDLKALFIKQS